MLDFNRTADLLSGLTLLRFFPADDGARLELAKLVAGMVDTEEKVGWLVHRVLELYSEWPGVGEIRAVVCSRYKPCDGISAYSAIYPDGIPLSKEAKAKQLATPELPALPPGHVASVDPELDQMVVKLAKAKAMPRGFPVIVDDGFSKTLRDAITAPADRPAPPPAPAPTNPDYKPITQEDVDRAVAEYRAKKHAEA